jgi:hypothetical protein
VPSSADPVAAALSRALATLVGAVAAVPSPRPVVVIDGRSGAGKSSLARSLVAAWPRAGGAALVALDEVYPGWDGLTAGSEYARRRILVPFAAGGVSSWRRWDWASGRRAGAIESLPARGGLVLEGAGALTARSACLADVRVWLSAPADARRRRALARDGATYRPHWERWAAQEDAHIEHEHPGALADLVLEIP